METCLPLPSQFCDCDLVLKLKFISYTDIFLLPPHKQCYLNFNWLIASIRL
jgi:hypothetical protein